MIQVENLVGGDLDDTFNFDDGAVIAGTANSIDGKSRTGHTGFTVLIQHRLQ